MSVSKATTEKPKQFIKNKFGYCCYAFDKAYSINKKGNKVKNKMYAIIYNLFIYPEFRLQGQARNILQSVIDNIRKTGYLGEIIIEANPKEKSISMKELTLFYVNMNLKVYKYEKNK